MTGCCAPGRARRGGVPPSTSSGPSRAGLLLAFSVKGRRQFAGGRASLPQRAQRSASGICRSRCGPMRRPHARQVPYSRRASRSSAISTSPICRASSCSRGLSPAEAATAPRYSWRRTRWRAASRCSMRTCMDTATRPDRDWTSARVERRGRDLAILPGNPGKTHAAGRGSRRHPGMGMLEGAGAGSNGRWARWSDRTPDGVADGAVRDPDRYGQESSRDRPGKAPGDGVERPGHRGPWYDAPP